MSECSICLTPLNDHISTLPCGHIFHSVCMIKTFRKFDSCPLCRARPHGIERETNDVPIDIFIQIMTQHALDRERERRSYISRSSNISRRVPLLKKLKKTMQQKQIEENKCKCSLNREWEAGLSRLRNNETILDLKRRHTNARKQYLRAYKKYNYNLLLNMNNNIEN
jgi:hypothetical protein